jgi:acylphosphatase
VRNLPNGDVEGCFEGNEGAVLELIDWCRRGSAAARVDRVAVTDGAFTGEFGSFQIRH